MLLVLLVVLLEIWNIFAEKKQTVQTYTQIIVTDGAF